MTVREALQNIYDKHGRLTPKLVLDEARDPQHPLHTKVFNVDPAEAAEAYYLDRAHELIRSVKVKYAKADGQLVGIRHWQPVRANGGTVYETSEKIAQDPILRELTLRQMQRDWEQMRSRYAGFAEFSDLIRGELEASA